MSAAGGARDADEVAFEYLVVVGRRALVGGRVEAHRSTSDAAVISGGDFQSYDLFLLTPTLSLSPRCRAVAAGRERECRLACVGSERASRWVESLAGMPLLP